MLTVRADLNGLQKLLPTLPVPEANDFIPWEHPGAVEAALCKLT